MAAVNLKEILQNARQILTGGGHQNARLDVKVLAEFFLKVSPIDQALEGHMTVLPAQEDIFMAAVARRLKFEPVSQIIGEKEFWSLSFKVTKDTLTPRPDSETLIEVALETIQDKNLPLKILDLGTGTGCLLLSLLSEFSHAQGLGVDQSEAALEVAKFNAETLGISGRARFIKSDWFENIPQAEKFDIIISNPPYIALSEKNSLSKDVKDYEPASALFADEEGLSDYKALAIKVSDHLTNDGFAIFEFGHKQAAEVTKIMKSSGAKKVTIHKDLAGNDRAAVIFF
jgi:release factor glutamine methyltransferase